MTANQRRYAMTARRFTTAVLFLVFTLSVGCSRKESVQENVLRALDQAGLKKVEVKEDRDKHLVRLGGRVGTPEDKNRAETVARGAAPGWTMANEISVEPVGLESEAKTIQSETDKAIERGYKAALVANQLDKQRIEYGAKNGALTLKGTVDSIEQRNKAEQIAAKTPYVQQVINQIEVKQR
jgi:osmotically-inducible protein OsmY